MDANHITDKPGLLKKAGKFLGRTGQIIFIERLITFLTRITDVAMVYFIWQFGAVGTLFSFFGVGIPYFLFCAGIVQTSEYFLLEAMISPDSRSSAAWRERKISAEGGLSVTYFLAASVPKWRRSALLFGKSIKGSIGLDVSSRGCSLRARQYFGLEVGFISILIM